MSNEDIDKTVREYGGVLPFKVYAAVCASPQIDHIRRDGDYIDLWSRDGRHWRIQTTI